MERMSGSSSEEMTQKMVELVSYASGLESHLAILSEEKEKLIEHLDELGSEEHLSLKVNFHRNFWWRHKSYQL